MMRRVQRNHLGAALTMLLLASCSESLADLRSSVDEPRVLAVRMVPAEARPGEAVELRALVAGPGSAEVRLNWAYCNARRPLSASGPVAPVCTTTHSEEPNELIIPLTERSVSATSTVRWTIPRDACRRFGPEPPPREGGEPPGRPVDPDPTGGFFVPITVGIDGRQDLVVSGARVNCAPATATLEVSADYRSRYTVNAHPFIRTIRWAGNRGAQGAFTAEGDTIEAAPGERVVVALTWPACPDRDTCGDGVCGPSETAASCPEDCSPVRQSCRGAERFIQFDVTTRELVERRESLRLSHYTSGGGWAEYGVGVTSDSPDTEVVNVWTAPAEPGEGFLWFVLRDDRGGVDWVRLPWRVE